MPTSKLVIEIASSISWLDIIHCGYNVHRFYFITWNCHRILISSIQSHHLTLSQDILYKFFFEVQLHILLNMVQWCSMGYISRCKNSLPQPGAHIACPGPTWNRCHVGWAGGQVEQQRRQWWCCPWCTLVAWVWDSGPKLSRYVGYHAMWQLQKLSFHIHHI